MVLAVLFLALPLAGVLVRTPWSDLGARLTESPDVAQAFRLSLVVSCWASALSPWWSGCRWAWVLARVSFPGRTLVRALVLLPMVLPPTVGGVALLMGFRPAGAGRAAAGGLVRVDAAVRRRWGAVVAAAFVAMPFLVISLEGTLTALRPRYEETAMSLGARPCGRVFTVNCRWRHRVCWPGRRCAGRGRWASSGRRSPSRAICPAPPRLCRFRSICCSRTPRKPPPRSPCCCSPSRWACWWRCAADGPRAPPTGRAGGPRRPLPRTPTSRHRTPAASRFPPTTPRGHKSVGRLHADVTGFTQLTLDAEPGTTIAVVGPNGAGKTTLLRALLGLTPRARATLRLGDSDVSAAAPHRRGVAWVPQDGALFPHLSALSNTAYGLRAHGVPRAEARRQAQRWLDRLGVGTLAHRRPAQLSGGQAQRVALARALAARPRLLLLDEPLAALDQTTRAHVRHTLRGHLAEFGGVCLLVTHDPVEAVSLADRVLVLDDGRALQDATAGRGHPAPPLTLGRPDARPQRLAGSRRRRRPRLWPVAATSSSPTGCPRGPRRWRSSRPRRSPSTSAGPRAAPATSGRAPSARSPPPAAGCAFW